jgi:hypothetical protein
MSKFYAIWKSSPNKPNQPQKMNMTVSDATVFITKNRDSLKSGEQYFTENQTTNEVDMMFSKTSTITPNKPMWLKGNRLVSTNPKSNPQKSMSDYGNPAWSNGSTNKKSKPKMTNYYKVINKYDNDLDKANLTKKEAQSRANRKGSQWIVKRQTQNDPASKFLRTAKQMESFQSKPTVARDYSPSAVQKRVSSKKPRTKWVGNMFRLSNSRLSQLGKTGTPKQKELAKSIIRRRRKK